MGGCTTATVEKVATQRGEATEVSTNDADDTDWARLHNYDFPQEKRMAAMGKYMVSLRGTGAFEETPARAMGAFGAIVPTRRVPRDKGTDAKARVLAKCCAPHGLDAGQTFVSTPARYTAHCMRSCAASQQWEPLNRFGNQ